MEWFNVNFVAGCWIVGIIYDNVTGCCCCHHRHRHRRCRRHWHTIPSLRRIRHTTYIHNFAGTGIKYSLCDICHTSMLSSSIVEPYFVPLPQILINKFNEIQNQRLIRALRCVKKTTMPMGERFPNVCSSLFTWYTIMSPHRTAYSRRKFNLSALELFCSYKLTYCSLYEVAKSFWANSKKK